MLIFLVGALLGVLVGCILCILLGLLVGCILCIRYIRYLRHEIAADIGPALRRVRARLDNLETAMNLQPATRHAELSERLQLDCDPRHDRGRYR